MSFNAIRENKILAKISESTVIYIGGSLFGFSFPMFVRMYASMHVIRYWYFLFFIRVVV